MALKVCLTVLAIVNVGLVYAFGCLLVDLEKEKNWSGFIGTTFLILNSSATVMLSIIAVMHLWNVEG